MSNWFTKEVDSGDVSLKGFAIRCAQAFLNGDVATPLSHEVKPDISREIQEIEEFRNLLERVRLWDDEEAEKEALVKYEEQVKKIGEAIISCKICAARYEALLAKVERWSPPTSYELLKSFMIEQLKVSMPSDDFVGFASQLKVQSGPEYRAMMIRYCEENIARLWEVIERKSNRAVRETAFMQGLFESLD